MKQISIHGVVAAVLALAAAWPIGTQSARAQAPSAPVPSFPMPATPRSYTGPQPAEGLASQSGVPGRTLGLEAICGSCQLEKYTDECVGRIEGPNFDGEGNLWMVSPATSSIFRVTPDRHCQVVAQTPAPNGTRFARDGRLFGVDNKLGVFWVDTKTFAVTFVTNKFGIPRSRDNPELRWVYDTKIIGNLVAVIVPVLRHLLAQES